MDEQLIIDLIKNDAWRMAVLKAVRTLNLPDWLIGAGFVRNPVWDYLHGYEQETAITDIDVAYFDSSDLNEKTEIEYQNTLKKMIDADWSVTNQARMAKINNQKTNYTSSEDAIAHWPETATAIGVKLLDDDSIKIIAPYGVEDLLSLNLRMAPGFGDGHEAFLARVEKKQWMKKWPKLKLISINYEESNQK